MTIESEIIKMLNHAKKIGISDLDAFAEEPEESHRPLEYYIVESHGDSVENFIYTATLAIQSYGKTLSCAAKNAVILQHIFDSILKSLPTDPITSAQHPEWTQISSITMTNNINWTDNTSDRYRYQTTFDVVYVE